MDFEAWWIAIPLGCFALGWFAARIDIRYVLRDARALPAAYFRGLNYLLREQHDKAVDSFVDVSSRDPHALDLQLALGSLFRRQGRVGEATAIHQSLVDRHDLPKDKRELAEFELAQDLHAAGLFDRAEAVYQKMAGTAYEAEAIAKLTAVLEQQKDWEKAIQARQRIEQLSGEPQNKLISQYHCEIADAALAAGKFAECEQALQNATEANRNNGRIALTAFRLATQRNDDAAAQQALTALQRTRPELVPLVADEITALGQRSGQPKMGVDVLAACQTEAPSVLGLTRLIDASLKLETRDITLQRLRQALNSQPTIRETARLLDLESRRIEVATDADGAGNHECARVMSEVATQLNKTVPNAAAFHCEQCGFKAPRYYWKCPGCNGWERFVASSSDR